jgi:hypothetical protein
MRRVQIGIEDVEDKERLRQRLDQAYENIYNLLDKLGSIEQRITTIAAAKVGPASLSDADRRLLRQIAVGSTASAAPAQNALEPKVDMLPPVSVSIDGQVVILSTDGLRYRFDGPTQSWVASSSTPHNLLSGTHPDTTTGSPVLGDILVGDGTPRWTKLAGHIVAAKRWLRQTGDGAISAIPAWDQPASTDLSDSSSIIKFNAQNQFDSANQFSCNAWQQTLQSVPNNTWTAITLDGSDVFDQGGLHDPATNNSRATVPTGGDGGFLVIGQLGFAANATGVRAVRLLVNGAVIIARGIEPAPSGSEPQFLTVATLVPAVATDYFELFGFQTSGVGLNTDVTNVGSTFLIAAKLF